MSFEHTNNDATDPVIFPGETIERLSQYVDFIRIMQSGDLNGALSKYKLDMITYGEMAIKWSQRMTEDQDLMNRYGQMMA